MLKWTYTSIVLDIQGKHNFKTFTIYTYNITHKQGSNVLQT